VRPESYVEINNFYTATVYEKGAEVIGMLQAAGGRRRLCRALDLYFDRHDGEACHHRGLAAVFEDATGRDLTQFKRWYTQAGTPRTAVEVPGQARGRGGQYTLTFRQRTPATPGSPTRTRWCCRSRWACSTRTATRCCPPRCWR
jgi:aminopeptidase N